MVRHHWGSVNKAHPWFGSSYSGVAPCSAPQPRPTLPCMVFNTHSSSLPWLGGGQPASTTHMRGGTAPPSTRRDKQHPQRSSWLGRHIVPRPKAPCRPYVPDPNTQGSHIPNSCSLSGGRRARRTQIHSAEPIRTTTVNDSSAPVGAAVGAPAGAPISTAVSTVHTLASVGATVGAAARTTVSESVDATVDAAFSVTVSAVVSLAAGAVIGATVIATISVTVGVAVGVVGIVTITGAAVGAASSASVGAAVDAVVSAAICAATAIGPAVGTTVDVTVGVMISTLLPCATLCVLGFMSRSLLLPGIQIINNTMHAVWSVDRDSALQSAK